MAKRRARTIDDQLRDIITARGLTAYAVAKGAGLHSSIMVRFMTDNPEQRRGLTSESLNKVCRWLGVFLEEGPIPPETVPTRGEELRRQRLKQNKAEA